MGDMNLNEDFFQRIPDVIIRNIAGFLDSESLFTLALMNSRLQDIIRPLFTTLRSEKVSPNLLAWVACNGSAVQKLDLSNCVSRRETVEEVISSCPRIIELNVINSNFGAPRILCQLRQLKALYLTETSRVQLDRSCGLKPCITAKNISIETGVQPLRLEKTMRFLKRCEIAEEIIVTLSGASDLEDASESCLPQMPASIWKTLHTVVCTRHMSIPNMAIGILKSIFAHNMTPGIREWISRDKLCYIYERGNFNVGDTDVIPQVHAAIRYLTDFHHANVSADLDASRIFRSVWGSPKFSSIVGLNRWHTSTGGAISETLTELDLRACHGSGFSGRLKIALIASSPSLQVLACSRCFFLFCGGGSDRDGGSTLQMGEFEYALMKRKLKKLHVEGVCHTQRCADNCPCSYPPRCEECIYGPQLTSTNLVNMRGLSHLDELTLSGVDLDASAFENITNSNVRVVRLMLTEDSEYEALSGFLNGCDNLECLKLESLDFEILSMDLWQALARREKLVKICFGCGDIPFVDPERELSIFIRMRQYMELVLQRVEFIHLHCSNERIRHIFCRLTYHMSSELQLKMRLTREALPQTIKFLYGDSIRRGRALCLSESPAGVVPPLGWDIN